MIISHEDKDYAARRWAISVNKYNGAYYYSREICGIMIPLVQTDRSWVTVNTRRAVDRAIVFIHNNKHPENYEWLNVYRDLVLVCGIPETCEKVAHLGTAIYLPLSVKVAEVEAYRAEKAREAAFVGRPAKRLGVSFPERVDHLEGMPRRKLLAEMAKYKRVYAVGRSAIEAKILGCEVMPYDERFPDPDRWQILDTREAARILQNKLNSIDE